MIDMPNVAEGIGSKSVTIAVAGLGGISSCNHGGSDIGPVVSKVLALLNFMRRYHWLLIVPTGCGHDEAGTRVLWQSGVFDQ